MKEVIYSEIQKRMKLKKLFEQLEHIRDEIIRIDDEALINYELAKLEDEEWDYLKITDEEIKEEMDRKTKIMLGANKLWVC